MIYSTATAALDLTTTSARVAIPGGTGQMLRILFTGTVTAVRAGINLGDVTVVAALPATGATSAGMVMAPDAEPSIILAPHGVTHIAGILNAGTCQLAVSRVGDEL